MDELTNDGMDGYDLPIRKRNESLKTRNTSWERNPCHASQNLYLRLGECNTYEENHRKQSIQVETPSFGLGT